MKNEKRSRTAPPKAETVKQTQDTQALRAHHTAARNHANKRMSATSSAAPSAALPKTGSINAAPDTPSLTAVKTDAALYQKQQDTMAALDYLNRRVDAGNITTAQKNALIDELKLQGDNAIGKSTDLQASQKEYYRSRGGDNRYAVEISDADLQKKIRTAQGIQNDSSSSYKGVAFEDMWGLTKELIPIKFTVRGQSLSKSEIDEVYEQLQQREEKRRKILSGEIDGDTPSYKGISYDELINKGGKEWIATKYGLEKKTLTNDELERVTAEVAQWEKTVQSKAKNNTALFIDFEDMLLSDNQQPLSINPHIMDLSVSDQANTLLEEIETEYGQGAWKPAKTTEDYLTQLEAVSKKIKQTVSLHKNTNTVNDQTTELTALGERVDNVIDLLIILQIYHSAYPTETAYNLALQEAEDTARLPAMSIAEIEKELKHFETCEQTEEIKARKKRFEEALEEKKTAAVIEKYESKMAQDENAQSDISQIVDTLTHEMEYTLDPSKAQFIAFYVKNGVTAQFGGFFEHPTDETLRLEINEMTKDQAKTYLYIENHYSSKEAEDYYNALGLKEKKQATLEKATKAAAKKEPIRASIASVLDKLHAPASLATNLADYISGEEIDPYNFVNTQLMIAEAEREGVSEKILEEYGETAATAYAISMGVLDYAVLLPVKKVIGPNALYMMLGTEAAASAVVNAKSRGIDDKKALAYGLICGSADIVFEKIPMNKLFGCENIDEISSILKRTLAEKGLALGEEFTLELTKTLWDCILNNNQSQYQLRVEELIAEGYSEDKAHSIASSELFSNYLASGAENIIIDHLFE